MFNGFGSNKKDFDKKWEKMSESEKNQKVKKYVEKEAEKQKKK
ncbi:hypothetical protein [Polycladospora coralii]|nr:hypothetical protein [Polycladospora coralii]